MHFRPRINCSLGYSLSGPVSTYDTDRDWQTAGWRKGLQYGDVRVESCRLVESTTPEVTHRENTNGCPKEGAQKREPSRNSTDSSCKIEWSSII